MKTILNVRLLGGFQLLQDKTRLDTVHSPRLQSLLAYLILHRDAPQARQHLAFLLFPDSPEAQARTNLRNLFHLLRHALPEADVFLYGDAQCLQWQDSAPYTLDVNDFEHAARAAKELSNWQRALDLYQGDLLPECYDDWILPERERLRLVYLNALEQASALCESAHDYLTAHKYAQQLLTGDPLREETYRRLMRLAALNSDRAGVVRFYKQCVNVLQRELDVEPSAETRTSYEEFSRLAAETRIDVQVSSEGKRLDNLPPQLTSLVGRAEELDTLRALVKEKCQVTLAGAGGVGKTRLALEVAAELRANFADGVWLVNLAPLTDEAFMLQAIASALNVREAPGIALADSVVNFLRSKRLLLVLDNCEHLIEPTRSITERLLQAAPQLHVLITSRRVLRLAGESVFRVQPLSFPNAERESISTLAQYSSVQLFVERARNTFASFALTNENADAVVKICQRLDGIPLALELAASRVNLLSPREIAARLDNVFHLLAHGDAHALPHHETMRATMDWSYQTLSEQERVLFRRVSVLASGFTVDAVEAVCADGKLPKIEILDLLSNLIDKSLVTTISADGKPRMRLLEPVREYAREKLNEAGEVERVSERHLQYFLEMAKEADEHIPTGEQKEWLMQLELKHDNLRAALEWSRTNDNSKARGLELATALVEFWVRRGYLAEGQYWLRVTLANYGAPTRTRAQALSGLGTLEYMQGQFRYAADCHAQALTLSRQLDDKPGIILSLSNLGAQLLRQAEYAQAENLFEQSLALARKEGDVLGIQRALHGLGVCALDQGDLKTAQEFFAEAFEFAQRGRDKRELAFLFLQLGEIARLTGDFVSSAKWYQDGIKLACELEDKWAESSGLMWLGLTKRHQGNLTEASALGKQGLRVCINIDSDLRTADCLEVLAGIAAAQGSPVRAARICGAAQSLRQVIQVPREKMDDAEYDESVAATQARLDETTFAKAWAEGRAMSKEQAVAYALADD